MIKNIFSTRNMVKDSMVMGEIPPSRKAYGTSLRIALPSVIEMTSIAFIQMASIAMVGGIGPEAVAAVGLVGQPRMIFLALIFALNVGVTAVVARRRGEDDRKAARLCIRQGLIISFCIGILMTILTMFLARPIMQLAGAQYDTIGLSTDYFRIVSMGLIFNAITMTIFAAQRGVGNTRVTLVVNGAASVVSVLFHFLLIDGRLFFPALGVRGAAIAMVISGFVGMCLAIGSLLTKGAYLKVRRTDSWRIDVPTMRSIAKVGSNSVLEQLCLRIGFFIYARVIAELGTAAFATHQIGMQLMNLSFTFADGIAVATTALVGQNLGRERPDLSIMYGKIGQRMAFIVSIFLVTFAVLGRYWFPARFTNDQEIIVAASQLFLIMVAILPFQTSQLIMAGSLRGSGDTRYVFLTMLITVALVRPLSSMLMVFVFNLGLAGAWYAIIVDQGLRLILLYGRFVRGKWTKIKL